MKKIIITIFCLVFLITSFIGCNETAQSNDNARYKFQKNENKFYLIIDDKTIEEIESNIDVGMSQQASIQFDSIDEFVNTVKSGKLNDHQLAIANKTFKKDSNGIIVCDFDNIKIPVHPDEFECQAVYWSGELYSFYLETSDDEIAYYHYLSKEKYNYQYENDYLTFFDIEGVSTVETVYGKEGTEYYYSTAKGKMKKIRYTLTEGNKVLIVDETYRLDMEDDSLPVSDDIPYRITIYGSNSNDHFTIDIFEPDNKPTVEWIKKFDVKPYK